MLISLFSQDYIFRERLPALKTIPSRPSSVFSERDPSPDFIQRPIHQTTSHLDSSSILSSYQPHQLRWIQPKLCSILTPKLIAHQHLRQILNQPPDPS